MKELIKIPQWESPIQVYVDEMKTKFENEIYKAVSNVSINVNKEELIRALNYDREQYEQGQYEMFELFSSVIYGKQAYFLETNGLVYSSISRGIMTKQEAYIEFLNYI